MNSPKFSAKCLTCWFLLAALLCCGCATNRIDWAGRVGLSTYDEVVLDMGPPDRDATLQSGSVVAEWITQRATHTTTVVDGYQTPSLVRSGGIYYPARVIHSDSYSPDFILRLTFGPDGKLEQWKKLRR